MLMIRVVKPISTNAPCAAIKFIPANCPALVRFVNEITTAAQIGIPDNTAVRPNAMDTEKYPRQIGIPSRIPSKNSCLFIIP